MAAARARLEGAHGALAGGFRPLAVSAAYYAMLYAARAALSEQERYAKTHSGTWTLFRETFVRDGRFDPELARMADQTLELREAGDYDARAISPEEAATVLAHAEEFVQAVERMLAG
jgi:uncharacterized protein (UPF0332 family)